MTITAILALLQATVAVLAAAQGAQASPAAMLNQGGVMFNIVDFPLGTRREP